MDRARGAGLEQRGVSYTRAHTQVYLCVQVILETTEKKEELKGQGEY